MNDAEITAFDNRVDTFGKNVRKFADRIRQVQQQMQELLNSFSDVQDTEQVHTTEQTSIQQSTVQSVKPDVQHTEPQGKTNEQPTVQASTTIVPETQVQKESGQNNNDQKWMDIINTLDIPSLLDVGNNSQSNIIQNAANITDDSAFTDTQSSTVQTQAPGQTEPKHETALDNDEMVKKANDIDVTQIMNTVMNQGSQKQRDL